MITVILGFLANENGDNQIPLITVCTAAGFISLIASIAVRKRAMNLWQNRNSSLGQRFQVAEMNRTSPIYLFISVNESLSITAMSVIGFLMLDQDNANAIASDDFLVHLVDLNMSTTNDDAGGGGGRRHRSLPRVTEGRQGSPIPEFQPPPPYLHRLQPSSFVVDIFCL
ncbi:unnamed protein product [Heligmosomoides polygyrus]|uniref:Uncharacterized protein n=1 Tax=Heligmosomoides polygyrus TaxID=6339 RepID=A0A3P8DIG9_HELPZ|nr:unnamed protein product [Heligmosomoides polygyrus]